MYLVKKLSTSSSESKIVVERDNELASLNLRIGATTFSLPGSKSIQRTKNVQRIITNVHYASLEYQNDDLQGHNEFSFKCLLEQPISPERLSSRTQGYPSTTLYIEFCRSGTDSITFVSPILSNRKKMQ